MFFHSIQHCAYLSCKYGHFLGELLLLLSLFFTFTFLSFSLLLSFMSAYPYLGQSPFFVVTVPFFHYFYLNRQFVMFKAKRTCSRYIKKCTLHFQTTSLRCKLMITRNKHILGSIQKIWGLSRTRYK